MFPIGELFVNTAKNCGQSDHKTSWERFRGILQKFAKETDNPVTTALTAQGTWCGRRRFKYSGLKYDQKGNGNSDGQVDCNFNSEHDLRFLLQFFH